MYCKIVMAIILMKTTEPPIISMKESGLAWLPLMTLFKHSILLSSVPLKTWRPDHPFPWMCRNSSILSDVSTGSILSIVKW
jgi:hypothetical protein